MKKYAFYLAVLLASGPAVLAQLPRPAAPPTSPQRLPLPPSLDASVTKDIPYATVAGKPLLLDIYDPGDASTDPRPAVVLIHGGAWSSYDKSTMHGMGMFLARCGFVGFSVDYRLFNGKENLWPAQLDDVQRAVRWIRAHAGKYNIDPDRIGAFGHSAGAQLAALLGMEDTRDNSDPALAKYSSRVEAVVDVSGPTDFTANHDPDGDAFLSAFFGGDYPQRAQVWQDASPVFHVAKNDAPFLIVHGTHDEDVALAQAQELTEKLKQAKISVKLVTVDDAHTFTSPEARRRLALESQEFFDQYLRPAR